jgi:hypothetical protein
MPKNPSRRRFLRGAAATLALAIGIPGSTEPPRRRKTPQANPTRAQSSIILDKEIFLPHVAGGGRMPRGPSKLGLHTVWAGGAWDFTRDVADAGARVALVKGVNDLGYMSLVKQHSPETVTVGRFTDPWGGGIQPVYDPAEAALWRMSYHMGRWQNSLVADYVDYWEVLNETDPQTDDGQPWPDGHAWLGEFFIECMEMAEQNEYKLALFSYSVGVPEFEEWEAIVETGVFERAKQGGHILALHEYNWPHIDGGWGDPLPGRPALEDRGVLTGRYRHLYEDLLRPRDQIIPLVITEAGYDPSVFHQDWDDNWLDRYVSEMAWYDDRLREDDYAIGCALFTLGPNEQWESWDYSEVLPELADYIISLKDAPVPFSKLPD